MIVIIVIDRIKIVGVMKDYLLVDLELEGYLKVNIEFLNGNSLF